MISRDWILSLLLFLPVLGFFGCHYYHGYKDPDKVATGFIQHDMPSYMAHAREYFENGFQLTYGNPFSHDPETPQIYFQPLTFLMGACVTLFDCTPSFIFNFLGFVFALSCIRVAISIYRSLFTLNKPSDYLGVICFIWGGGLLAIAGTFKSFFEGFTFNNIFQYDPQGGWWFLNFGRNLIYATESLYHLLVLISIFWVIKNKIWLSFLTIAFLCLSHPFSGIQIASTYLLWGITERGIFKNSLISVRYVLSFLILCSLHLFYYVYLLPRLSEEHASVMSQFTVSWNLSFNSFVWAYLLVFIFFTIRISKESFLSAFLTPINRLFLALLVTSLCLANHDLLITPHQPLHFTRGYIWMPLFLLGAPYLVKLFQIIQLRFRKPLRAILTGLVVFIFLSDNLIWFGFRSLRPTGIYLSEHSHQALEWLKQNSQPHDLLVSNKGDFCYYAMAHTPMRSWVSHIQLTPNFETRYREVNNFLKAFKEPKLWATKEIIFALNVKGKGEIPHMKGLLEVYRNDEFRIFKREPPSN